MKQDQDLARALIRHFGNSTDVDGMAQADFIAGWMAGQTALSDAVKATLANQVEFNESLTKKQRREAEAAAREVC